MRKIFTIAALIALLAVPFMAVAANANVCPQGALWSEHQDPPLADVGSVEYCVKGGNPDNGGYLVRGSFAEVTAAVEGNDHDLSHWSYKLDVYEACDETIQLPDVTTYSDWSDWIWDEDRGLFVRTRIKTVTRTWVDALDRQTICDEQFREFPEEETQEIEYSLDNTCRGWAVYDQFQNLIEGAPWNLPFVLEVAFSVVLDDRIREPDDCLQERGKIFVRIGGRCTEDGDSQEIGYIFDDGDFDGARLIITRQDGVEVANVGEGSDFFPARAVGYSWQIIWFNGETREVLDSGEFEVNKCDLPEPTPTPKPPDEHPSTGGEMDAGLAVVTGLMGFALAGIGGSILFMKRRASR